MVEIRYRGLAFVVLLIIVSGLALIVALYPPADSSASISGSQDSVPEGESSTLEATNGQLQPAAVHHFLDLLGDDRATVFRALSNVQSNWHPGSRTMLLELLRFARNPISAKGIVDLLERKSTRKINRDPDAWYRTVWSEPYEPHPNYPSFKARLYEQIDPVFREYFVQGASATIRLDEVRWGGVHRDGIPPLKNPETLSAKDATYLADTDVVFGVEIGDEARAYPKRILAWHEMVKDVVGSESINGVYCTLCGSMIVYRTTIEDGTHYELGTSGFLYRSNKLMYDARTASLWSTITGKPVIGELVGKGIQLQPHYVVTTTWGQWRAKHPETRVLSLNTGHQRDYSEGFAYREYFETDELMFAVPELDRRLKNKDEVFIIRDDAQPPFAISVQFLQLNPVYHDSSGSAALVVITNPSGANRAYSTGSHRFTRTTDSGNVIDEDGAEWKVDEQALINRDGTIRLPRIPSHRAFWFGWYAAHPNTRLVD